METIEAAWGGSGRILKNSLTFYVNGVTPTAKPLFLDGGALLAPQPARELPATAGGT